MNRSIKRVGIAALGLAAVLSAVAGSLIVLMTVFDYPGGMSPSYRATDHDTRLTPIAREAIPLIRSIGRYYQAHGQCPQVSADDLAELQNTIGSDVVATIVAGEIHFGMSGAATRWIYYSADRHRNYCSLSRKLGWDPALVWQRDGEKTNWVFVPGDGSEEKPIQLDIGE
jgi:hypothetical protein